MLTSYILGVAVMTPLSGWLSFKIGRKPLYLISVGAFVIISMLCGIAQNLPEMVLLRLLQGCSGAALMPLTQATLLDLWPASMLQSVMALWSAVVMVGPIVGPILGGYLTEAYSWRWVFYINLPVGALAFILIYLGLHKDPGGQQRPFDFLGFAAIVMFAAGAQLMVDRGPGQDWLSSPEVWVEAIISTSGLYLFIMQTLTARNPFFHTDLFRDPQLHGHRSSSRWPSPRSPSPPPPCSPR